MTDFLNDLLHDMARTFFQPRAVLKEAWRERRASQYIRAAWSLFVALFAWGFLLSIALKPIPLSGEGLAFHFATVMIAIWVLIGTYIALVILALMITSIIRRPKDNQ